MLTGLIKELPFNNLAFKNDCHASIDRTEVKGVHDFILTLY